jgi:NAD dependent epimerase/dehydratase
MSVKDWNGTSVLVTGGSGFIGSHLVEALLGLGARVRVLARCRTAHPGGGLGNLSDDVVRRLTICQGDIVDAEGVGAAAAGVDCIFHLAALVSVAYSFEHPHELLATNTIGTLNVLTAAKDAGVQRVLVVSSSEVYGTARYVPIDERHPLQAQSPYAASKISAEKFAESFHRSYGLPVTIVRPFNTYGVRQSLRAVIPTIVAQALHGRTIKLGDVSTKRDFTYVTDTVAGFLALMTSDEATGKVFNLGSANEVSIAEVVERVKVLTGSTAAVECEPQRVRPADSEVRRLLADTQYVRRMTGWHPQVSLDNGLKAVIAWISETIGPNEAARYHY